MFVFFGEAIKIKNKTFHTIDNLIKEFIVSDLKVGNYFQKSFSSIYEVKHR